MIFNLEEFRSIKISDEAALKGWNVHQPSTLKGLSNCRIYLATTAGETIRFVHLTTGWHSAPSALNNDLDPLSIAAMPHAILMNEVNTQDLIEACLSASMEYIKASPVFEALDDKLIQEGVQFVHVTDAQFVHATAIAVTGRQLLTVDEVSEIAKSISPPS